MQQNLKIHVQVAENDLHVVKFDGEFEGWS